MIWNIFSPSQYCLKMIFKQIYYDKSEFKPFLIEVNLYSKTLFWCSELSEKDKRVINHVTTDPDVVIAAVGESCTVTGYIVYVGLFMGYTDGRNVLHWTLCFITWLRIMIMTCSHSIVNLTRKWKIMFREIGKINKLIEWNWCAASVHK